MIITITGGSGVGKTTALEALAKNLPKGVKVFHFDDLGMPDWSTITDTKKWQRETTLIWMDKIIDIAIKEDIHIIFEGSTEIEFFKEGFAKHHYSDFKIILLDCSPETMEKRLIKRGQPELFQKDMVNWSNFLRTEAINNKAEIINTDLMTPKEISQLIINQLV